MKRLYILLLGVILIFFAFAFADNQITKSALEIGNIDKAKMKVVEGIPFVKLYGNYYEMGFEYGKFFKEPLSEIQKNITPFIPEIVKDDSYKELKDNLPDKYRDFLKGVSESSGISTENLLYISFYETIDTECSALLVRIYPDGCSDLLHAKNRDKINGSKYQAVIEFNPGKEYRYIVTACIGAFFIHQGLNEKGVAISSNTARFSKPPSHKDDVLRMVLESSTSLKEADKIIKTHYDAKDHATILVVSSSCENDGIIYDIGNSKIVRHELKNNKSLFVTNYYLSKDMTPNVFKNPDTRYNKIDTYLKNNPIIKLDDLIELLSIYPVNNQQTLNSIIFNGKAKEIYLAFSTEKGFAAWKKWVRYNWGSDEVTVYK